MRSGVAVAGPMVQTIFVRRLTRPSHSATSGTIRRRLQKRYGERPRRSAARLVARPDVVGEPLDSGSQRAPGRGHPLERARLVQHVVGRPARASRRGPCAASAPAAGAPGRRRAGRVLSCSPATVTPVGLERRRAVSPGRRRGGRRRRRCGSGRPGPAPSGSTRPPPSARRPRAARSTGPRWRRSASCTGSCRWRTARRGRAGRSCPAPNSASSVGEQGQHRGPDVVLVDGALVGPVGLRVVGGQPVVELDGTLAEAGERGHRGALVRLRRRSVAVLLLEVDGLTAGLLVLPAGRLRGLLGGLGRRGGPPPAPRGACGRAAGRRTAPRKTTAATTTLMRMSPNTRVA